MRIRTLVWGTIFLFEIGQILAQNDRPQGRSSDDPFRPIEADYVIHDFRFSDGATLPELKIHYRTLGRPTRDGAGQIQNAILLLHGTTGTGDQFMVPSFRDAMFGRGQPLDATKYYIVLPDSIGLGGSSKPSDGLHDRFPHYGYNDMVEAQHALLIDGLQMQHIRAVFGTSMGGMHAWLWAEKFPTMADGVIAVACLPDKISGRNLLWRRIITTAIRSDPTWNNGDYKSQPPALTHVFPVFALMTGNPTQFQNQLPTLDRTMDYLQKIAESCRDGRIDANDIVHRIEASADYDPAPKLGNIQAPVLAINFADDELNPPVLGVMDRAKGEIRNLRYVLIPASDESRGHKTLAEAAVYGEYVADFLKAGGGHGEAERR
jgi:homoserine O-acetyltransferase